MKVICKKPVFHKLGGVNAGLEYLGTSRLTLNKTYDVISASLHLYLIIDDSGNKKWYELMVDFCISYNL